jgi:hypothetical protein
MPSIPWDVIGAGGGFALLVLVVVFTFLIKWSNKMKKELQSEAKNRCCDVPEVREAMKNNIITAQALTEMKSDLKTLTRETIKQTTIMKIIMRRNNGGPMNFDLD